MSRRAPTIHDVARLAGVSTSTASRALGNYGRVSGETRDRVLSAIQELGYRPNNLARSMITRRTNTLGIVCADISNPFFAGVVRGVADEAEARGYSTLLTNTYEDLGAERSAVDLLLDKQADGLIVAPADVVEVEHLAAVQAAGRHVVLIDRPSGAIDADTVTVDDVRATQEAVTHLLELGHRRIGILAELKAGREADWPSYLGTGLDRDRGRLNPSAARLLGYLKAHRAAGVRPDPALICRTGSYDADAAAAATRRLLAAPDRPTALITIDNVMTLGAFRVIHELGIDVPGELSLIGFDNLDWTTLVTPALTVIEQPLHAIGSRAAQRLIDRIDGDQSPPGVIHLPTRFVKRDSCAAVEVSPPERTDADR